MLDKEKDEYRPEEHIKMEEVSSFESLLERS